MPLRLDSTARDIVQRIKTAGVFGKLGGFTLKKSALAASLASVVMGTSASAQGRYDEQALRGPLSDLPFANTALGRESHRFASAEVNRYRIYDYYRRQAQWHVNQPNQKQDLLLPFPGLDGGRRGHWGVTNEASIQAIKRQTPPILPTLLARGEYGLHHLTFSENDAVLVYDIRIPGVQKVLTNARLVSPHGPFRGDVDCWGFGIQASGNLWAQANTPEWSAGNQAITFQSYHMSAGEVAYRHHVGGSELLEQITLHGKEDEMVMVRRFAFPEPIPEMHYSPFGSAHPLVMEDGIYLAPAQKGGHHHFLTTGGGLKADFDIDLKAFKLESTARGAWMEIRTWKGADGTRDLARIKQIQARDPVLTIHQKKPNHPQILSTSGIMNADAAASTQTYEIDDIELPFENPWNQPMTLSGIDFDDKGIAYVCSMVGDVWRVEGLDNNLQKVKWRRYASGLNLPLGLVVVDGVPFVSCRKQIIELHDRDGDGEADEYRQFNRIDLPLGFENGGDLRRDQAGNFYRNGSSGIFSMSADGTQIRQVGSGSRNPLGIAVREDGLVLSDSSEGEGFNGTCTIFESEHPENVRSTCKKKRILYLPRGIDNSPGSRMFVREPRFGPLGDSILGLSYGTGSWYHLLRDDNGGTPQAALHVMPGEFASGAMRLARNPADGQIYCVGFDGWGDYATKEGCFHRLRFTGKNSLMPQSWQAHRNGLLIRFNRPVDPASLHQSNFFAQQWNTVDYRTTYGSADFSVRSPQAIGHDRLMISRILLQQDPHIVFFEICDLLPAQYTHLHGRLRATSGASLELDLYCTINRMRADFPGAAVSLPGKTDTLIIREEEQNGNTYEVVTDFFDKKAGRDVTKRPVADGIRWEREELDYNWVRNHIIDQKCIMCHQSGTPHDLSTYEKLTSKVVPGNPTKSHLIGILRTKTMPPHPLPLLHPSHIEALEHWIKAGAPRE